MPLLIRVRTRNYRSLADVTVDVGGVTVLFGHNGSGKSSFLDTLWFLRDCALNGVDVASERRSHGIGLLWDGADEREPIVITVEVPWLEYEVRCSLGSGRVRLREPNKLALERYLDHAAASGPLTALDRLLRATQWHQSRSFRWWQLKLRGSSVGASVALHEDGRNLWSVLQNLHGRRSVDARYDAILGYMREGFPGFKDLVFEATGQNSVYCSLVDTRRRGPVAASGMSDGHLQMLLLLTALFAEGPRESLLLLDEPEISLHPWPTAVLARAVRRASERGAWDPGDDRDALAGSAQSVRAAADPRGVARRGADAAPAGQRDDGSGGLARGVRRRLLVHVRDGRAAEYAGVGAWLGISGSGSSSLARASWSFCRCFRAPWRSPGSMIFV